MIIPPLDQQICFMMNAASRKLVGAYKPFLQPLGITYTQYLVLLCLWKKDGLSLDDIGRQLSLDSGTLTPLIKRLEVKGLLTRTRRSDDERCLHIQLTEKGTSLKTNIPDIFGGIASCITLSKDDQSQLRKYLLDLIDSFNGSAI